MQEDEEVSRSRRLEKLPLEIMSVADLRSYIGELAAEIARAETAIAAKEGAKGHADSFFRQP